MEQGGIEHRVKKEQSVREMVGRLENPGLKEKKKD